MRVGGRSGRGGFSSQSRGAVRPRVAVGGCDRRLLCVGQRMEDVRKGFWLILMVKKHQQLGLCLVRFLYWRWPDDVREWL